MKKLVFSFAVLGLLLFSACVPAKEQPKPETFAQMLQLFTENGLSAAEKEPAEGSSGAGFFSAPARYMAIGEETVSVYEYDSNEAMEAGAATVDKGGTTIGIPGNKVYISWAGVPHFYKNGNLIVLYVGGDEGIVSCLTETFGPPFAGEAVVHP